MNNVIACIDGVGQYAEAVCDLAAWSGNRLQAPLTLLHVLDHQQYPVATTLDGTIGLGSRETLLDELATLDEQRTRVAREQGRLMLEAAQERVVSAGIEQPLLRQRHGDLVQTLTDLEEEMRLLVIGRHSTSSDPHHISAQLEEAIRSLHRPILVAQPEFRPPQRFLIAYDASATARKAVSMIASSPLLKGIPCELRMVGAATADQQALLKEAQLQLETAGFEVNAGICAGEVVDTLLNEINSQQADMLVMGAYGHSRIREWLLGSTTSKMLRQVQVPLLLLR